MDRKNFFKILLPASAGMLFSKSVLAGTMLTELEVAMPPYLKAGDTVGITCPAGAVDQDKIQYCVKTLKKWGLNIVYGTTVGKQWMRFGGTDRERLEDFQSMLDSQDIKAILFGKGGYGTMRIIDQLNWDKFRLQPKWLVGYSDLTTVHMHVHANLGIPTIHADMVTGFTEDYDQSSVTLFDALHGNPLNYCLKSTTMNRLGKASATMVGGNLSLLVACAGSRSDISTDSKILFIEDVSEYKYAIDRMIMSLKRAGKLDNLAGLVVGGFTSTRTEKEDPFQMSIEEIIWDKVKEYEYPVCFNFPAGHMKENRALKFGVPYTLDVGANDVSLQETASIRL